MSDYDSTPRASTLPRTRTRWYDLAIETELIETLTPSQKAAMDATLASIDVADPTALAADEELEAAGVTAQALCSHWNLQR